MVEVELYYDGSTPVSFYDAEGLVPTTATLALLKTDGTTVSTPTVTNPSLSTTIAAGTTAAALTLASVTGLAVGDPLKVTSLGVDYIAKIAKLNTSAKIATLEAALPVTPATGDAVKNLKMTASVSAPGTANIGPGLRLVWTFDDGTTTRRAGQPASVVRWPWTAPVAAQDVRDVLTVSFGESRSESYCAKVADRVNEQMRAKILQTGRRPWLFLSSESFRPAAEQGIRYVLAQDGIALGGQPYEALRELRFAFDDALTAVLTSVAGYDKDMDGKVLGERPMGYSIRTVR